MKRLPDSFNHRGIRTPRWLVLEAPHARPTGRVFAMLDGKRFSAAFAEGIGQTIADLHGVQVAVVEEKRGPNRNPTLVHHGLVGSASFHLLSEGGTPLADLYTDHLSVAKKIGQVFANELGYRVVVLDNAGEPGGGPMHTHRIAATARRRRNPAGPKAGELWTDRAGTKDRVVSVSRDRVQVVNTESGAREWVDMLEFRATHKPPRTRPNPKRRGPVALYDALGNGIAVGSVLVGTGLSNAGRSHTVLALKGSRVLLEPHLGGRPFWTFARHYRVDATSNPSRSRYKRAQRRGLRRPVNRKTFRAATQARYLSARGARPGLAAKAISYLERSSARRAARGNPKRRNARGGPRVVYNALLGGWYVVTGPHQAPLNGRFNSKAEAQAWLSGGRRANPGRALSVPERHQLKVARDTLKMSEAFARIMGGPNHAEAREIIYRLTGKRPNPVTGRHGETVREGVAILLDAAGYGAQAKAVRSGEHDPLEALRFAHGFEGRPVAKAKLAQAIALVSKLPARLRNPKARHNARRSPSLVVGDRVQYTAAFLRSIGVYSGPLPFLKGTVVALDNKLSMTVATVKWDGEDEPQRMAAGVLKKLAAMEANPRPFGGAAKERRDAERMFETWHEFSSKRVKRVKVPSRRIPRHVVELGKVRRIDYDSNKYEGKKVSYTHDTKPPYPILATDPKGSQLYLVGGRMKPTADGLVN